MTPTSETSTLGVGIRGLGDTQERLRVGYNLLQPAGEQAHRSHRDTAGRVAPTGDACCRCGGEREQPGRSASRDAESPHPPPMTPLCRPGVCAPENRPRPHLHTTTHNSKPCPHRAGGGEPRGPPTSHQGGPWKTKGGPSLERTPRGRPGEGTRRGTHRRTGGPERAPRRPKRPDTRDHTA